MKNVLLIAIFLFTVSITAQQKNEKSVFEKQGNLIKATYYHDNGEIAQTGYYKNNKVHGQWRSYDLNGKKTAVAQYEEGRKTGKWFFWNKEKLSEVDYINNRIVAITRWNNTNQMVSN